MSTHKAATKFSLYSTFINDLQYKQKYKDKLNANFNVNLSDQEWKKINILPFRITKDTSLTVYVDIYAGTFFRGCEGANLYACTSIRGSAPDYSLLSLYIRFTLVLTFAVR